MFQLSPVTMDIMAHRLEHLKTLPWRLYVFIVIGAFVSATVISTAFGYFLLSKFHSKVQTALLQDSGVGFNIPEEYPTLSDADIKKILERNIFNSANEVGTTAEKSVEEIPRTTLPIKVLGLIYAGSPEGGLAMIELSTGAKKGVSSYLVGDIVDPSSSAILKEVQRDRVLVFTQGRMEYAPLEENAIRRSSRKKSKSSVGVKSSDSLAGTDAFSTSAPPEVFKEEGFERNGGEIKMSEEYKARLLGADFANVLQDAKANPNITAEGVKGFRLDRIRQSSIYEKSGLVNGDIVEEINGVPLTDAAQAIKLLQGLRNEGDIELRVNRGGQKLNFNLKSGK